MQCITNWLQLRADVGHECNAKQIEDRKAPRQKPWGWSTRVVCSKPAGWKPPDGPTACGRSVRRNGGSEVGPLPGNRPPGGFRRFHGLRAIGDCITIPPVLVSCSGPGCNATEQNSGCCCKTIQAGSWVPSFKGSASGLVFKVVSQQNHPYFVQLHLYRSHAPPSIGFSRLYHIPQPSTSSITADTSAAKRRSTSAVRRISLRIFSNSENDSTQASDKLRILRFFPKCH